MECKVGEGRYLATLRYRFNRYIVECKESNHMIMWANGFRFNRYIVECKDRRQIKRLQNSRKDLIDTLWNVKTKLSRIDITGYFDLIDTLWNVKMQRPQGIGTKSGFNRYIVECKVNCSLKYCLCCARFNRYIVECKVSNRQRRI